jgi:hypothetical protein
MNIGQFTRLPYDKCAYPDRLQESTDPLNYKLNIDQIYNCDRCLSTYGPRSSLRGHGVNIYKDAKYDESQDMVDLESILSNRNVKGSQCKSGKVNPINPLNSKLYNTQLCSNKLDPEYTRLMYAGTNRDANINRFYNTIHNAQDNIFWNFEINSSLELKDNHHPHVPRLWLELSGPKEDLSKYKTCDTKCMSTAMCPKSLNKKS